MRWKCNAEGETLSDNGLYGFMDLLVDGRWWWNRRIMDHGYTRTIHWVPYSVYVTSLWLSLTLFRLPSNFLWLSLTLFTLFSLSLFSLSHFHLLETLLPLNTRPMLSNLSLASLSCAIISRRTSAASNFAPVNRFIIINRFIIVNIIDVETVERVDVGRCR